MATNFRDNAIRERRIQWLASYSFIWTIDSETSLQSFNRWVSLRDLYFGMVQDGLYPAPPRWSRQRVDAIADLVACAALVRNQPIIHSKAKTKPRKEAK